MGWLLRGESDAVIGDAMFSRFHIEGKYENELLMLTLVAMKTQLQRQYISKDLLEYEFEEAREMGFKEILVDQIIADRLKNVFAEWINNGHNNFEDENTIILCVELTDGVLFSCGIRYEL